MLASSSDSLRIRARWLPNFTDAGFDQQGQNQLQGHIRYQGDSAIIDPLGEVLQEASSGGEEILIADIEVEKVSEVRDAFPFMNDRRK